MPGGSAQGEPITLDHIETIRYAERLSQIHGEKSQKRLIEQIKNQKTAGDVYGVRKDQMSLLQNYKKEFKASLHPGFTGAYEVNTEGAGGVRDHPDYASANEALRNSLAQIAMNMGTDPSSAINELSSMTQDAYQLHEDQIDNSMVPWPSLGAGGGNYKTYVPRNVGNNNTQEYINMLHDYITKNAELQTPQQSADKFLTDNINNVFANMVTRTDAK